MRVLFIADVIGQPGRKVLNEFLPRWIPEKKIDLVIANAENASGGFGLTPPVAEEIFASGVEVITLGNHTWDRKEIMDIIDDPRIVRPANYPPGCPGQGWRIVNTRSGLKTGIMNLMGRIYMLETDCPFRKAQEILPSILKHTKIIIVDMHAEITSEKVAMGWFLDGQVSAVIGTHTHVQTADERVLPGGTAYITDVGMTGARDSVIGIEKEIIIKRYLTRLPVRFEIARGDPVFSGVLIEIDEKSARASGLERFTVPAS